MMAETYRFVLCDLETYLCPHAVLFKRQDQRWSIVQLGSGSGEEQHTITLRDFRYHYRSGSKCPIKRAGSGYSAYVLMSVRRRSDTSV